MDPSQIDFTVDFAYGLLLFLSIVLIVTVGTGIGIAFGFGALISYIIHVAWKMSRFDPNWMSKEVVANVEETITEEVTESVGEKVTDEVTANVEETITEEVTESVGEKVTDQVTANVEETLSAEIDAIIDQLEEVNERIDRRPRPDDHTDQGDSSSPSGGQTDRTAPSRSTDSE